MKRSLAVAAGIGAVLSVGLVAPPAAQASGAPTAKQVAKSLGCTQFKKAALAKGDKIKSRTRGTCKKSGVTYYVADWGSSSKAKTAVYVMDVILGIFNTKMETGIGWSWTVTDNKSLTFGEVQPLPKAMKAAVKRRGGTIKMLG